jgi:hypothetical protein
VSKSFGVNLGETAFVADLGGSSEYSCDSFEN